MTDKELRILIGTRIATARKVADLKQDELANIIGVNKQSLSRWERGLRSPDAEYLRAIAKTCNCTADFLLGFSDVLTVK